MNSSESIALWSLYNKNNSVSIRISFRLIDIIDYMKSIENVCCDIDTVSLSPVAYYNIFDKTISLESRKIKINKALLIDDLANDKELTGRIKYNVWDYEREARILIKFNDHISNRTFKITNSMINNMRITFSPWIDKNTAKDYQKRSLKF